MSTTDRPSRTGAPEPDEEQLWSWVDRDAPELEEYLARHPERRDEVEELRGTIRGLAGLDRARVDALPESVGPYRVVGRLGEGGMGVVYEAEQEAPSRRVALKVLRGSGVASADAVRRFRVEAETLARLRHPGMAAIYEAGTTDDGLHWFAMELVRGRTVSEHAASLDLRAKVELVRRVAEVVRHAHDAGVVHRDLKPANVLVEEDGTPRVLDFGLSRLTGDDLASSLASTDAGRVLGTLPYMSPEQALADGTEVGPASDVYSLGVMLYELLAGRLPLDLSGQNLVQAARTIAERPPRRPGAFARVPRELDAIALTALDKDPRRRYADAGALADDLGRFLDRRPVLARRPTLAYRARKLVARNRLASALVGLAIVLGGWAGCQTARRVDFDAPLVGDWYPQLSPYEDIRWNGETPEVLVEDEWAELVEIDGVRVSTVLAFCRETTEDRELFWRKRFEEDLWQVMWRMGRLPHAWVDLTLRRAGESETFVETQAWTPDRRRQLYRNVRERRRRLPFSRVRFARDGTAWVRAGEGQEHELLSVAGVSTAELIATARAVDEDWQLTLAGELGTPLSLTAGALEDEVEVVLGAPDGTRVERTLPVTAENAREAVAALRRTPFAEAEWWDGELEVELAGDPPGGRGRVVSLEGQPLDALVDAAAELGARSARRLVETEPVRVLHWLGLDPGDTIRVVLRGDDDVETTFDEVPLVEASPVIVILGGPR